MGDKLYNYIFHFNHLKDGGRWAAIPRGKEADYFNDMNGRIHNGILFSEKLEDLIDFLCSKK